jgi:hypothetical protein
MAASVSTQHALQDLRDLDLTIRETVSVSDKAGGPVDLFLSSDGDTHVPVLYCI